MKKPIGNIFIILSALLLIYIYYPLSTAYIPVVAPKVEASSNGKPTISIPKINAQAVIIENIDPASQFEYEQALKNGVAEAKGYSLPGQGKLVYIFAHSSLPPWEMTRTNTPFLRLGELSPGDEIMISQNGRQYHYQVFAKQEFWPTQTQIFGQEKNKDELVLQTCTPIGTDLKRLLVFARPV